jgi:NAD(P)-dependent dehydrogenase (short-subunit alcohol dehydrogenase family)
MNRSHFTAIIRRAFALSLAFGVFAITFAHADEPFQTPVASDGQQLVALITGSTSGLGREVALRLADAGAHVIVHGRNPDRGAEVVQEIEERGGTARFYQADFAEMDAVRELGKAVLRDYERLDLLVNNAGISGPAEHTLTADGFELAFQVNYLSHFLLTDMLMPLLEAGAPARIINVASGAQQPIDFDDPQIEQNYSSGRSYGQSKLAQITYTKALAERLDGKNIETFSLHPETFMPTRMVMGRGIEPRSTIEEGADNVMRLITERDLESGTYFNRSERAEPHAQARDRDAREKLWALSEQWVEGS